MRTLVLLLFVTGCGVAHETPCGIDVGGDRDNPATASTLTPDLLQRAVRRALNGATFTTDPRLSDPVENCRAMEGFTVYTKQAPTFVDDGEEIFGVTRCWKSEIIVGTPESGSWQFSGLVHELFHVMQRCRTPLPIDSGRDAHHSNWDRDLIFYGIGKGEDHTLD